MSYSPVDRSQRMECPGGVYLCTYGGGDALKLHNSVLSVWLQTDVVYGAEAVGVGGGSRGTAVLLSGIGTDSVWDSVVSAHAAIMSVPADSRVPRLPSSLQTNSKDQLEWSTQLLVTTMAAGTETFNVMAQSWLFEDELTADPSRLGVSRWPLVGVFKETGLAAPNGDVAAAAAAAADADPADAGFGGRLAACDQHTHLVKEVLELDGHSLELEDWHHGGDTARIRLQDVEAGGAGWVILVDLEKMRAIECLVIALPASAKDRVKIGADAAAAAAAATKAAASEAAGGGGGSSRGSGESTQSAYLSALISELSSTIPDMVGLDLLSAVVHR